jgi:Protein of unknown function (DUF2971)
MPVVRRQLSLFSVHMTQPDLPQLPRVYIPSQTDTIYHYCDGPAFHAICTTHTLRLSDIFSMNDHMEMHWGYMVWERAASARLATLGREFLDRVGQHLHSSGGFGLVTCSSFSQASDVLSQWRAYAADGRGYAIGFGANLLAALPALLLRVLYDEEEQVREVGAFVDLLHKAEQYDAANNTHHFPQMSLLLGVLLAGYKNPAFREEAEVRLVHLLDFVPSNDAIKLVDVAEDSHGVGRPSLTVMFRMRGHTPVAYVDIDFSSGDAGHPITEVVLGPRNSSLPSGISIFLETIGLQKVAIRSSSASYRG